MGTESEPVLPSISADIDLPSEQLTPEVRRRIKASGITNEVIQTTKGLQHWEPELVDLLSSGITDALVGLATACGDRFSILNLISESFTKPYRTRVRVVRHEDPYKPLFDADTLPSQPGRTSGAGKTAFKKAFNLMGSSHTSYERYKEQEYKQRKSREKVQPGRQKSTNGTYGSLGSDNNSH